MSAAPRVSLVIRSYKRLPALVALLEQMLAQRHDSFEIVVVEQTPDPPAELAARLAELERGDARLRILRHPPLGGARARNVGVAAARGEIVVLLDDDDRPVGDDWLARFEAAMTDPRCLGVTCRHLWGRDDDRPGALYRAIARRRCMRLSPILRLPGTWARLDEPVARVDLHHGTGCAIRKSAFLRFGGWDVDTPIEDEASFAYRAAREKAADEYFAFAPEPRLRRDLDVGGGLGKRHSTVFGYYKKFMLFVHHIVGRYHPWRVRLCYPGYVFGAAVFVLSWIWGDSRAHDTTARRLAGSLGFLLLLPIHAARVIGEPLGRPDGAAMPGSALLAGDGSESTR